MLHVDPLKRARDMNLLIYKSRCKGLVNWDLINSIISSSAQNNPKDGITGVLVASETHFMQILEGEYETLNATFERIARDPRHDTVQLISFTETEKRKFSDWGMHGIGLFDLNRDLLFRLCLEFGEDNGNVRFPSTPGKALAMVDILLADRK